MKSKIINVMVTYFNWVYSRLKAEGKISFSLLFERHPMRLCNFLDFEKASDVKDTFSLTRACRKMLCLLQVSFHFAKWK